MGNLTLEQIHLRQVIHLFSFILPHIHPPFPYLSVRPPPLPPCKTYGCAVSTFQLLVSLNLIFSVRTIEVQNYLTNVYTPPHTQK